MARDEVRLQDLRKSLASAVAHAARRLWRRGDLEQPDLVILDLLSEALARWGHLYGPKGGSVPVAVALAEAPQHIQEAVAALQPLASRSSGVKVLKEAPSGAKAMELSVDAVPFQQSSSDGATSVWEVLSAPLCSSAGRPGPAGHALVDSSAGAVDVAERWQDEVVKVGLLPTLCGDPDKAAAVLGPPGRPGCNVAAVGRGLNLHMGIVAKSVVGIEGEEVPDVGEEVFAEWDEEYGPWASMGELSLQLGEVRLG